MGAVYWAEDLRLHGRPCAVKVLDREARGQDDAARFGRELRIISALRSPFTVQVLDSGGTEDDDPFIVMELLDGPTISGLVASEERLHGARAARLFQGILVALCEAHDLGIVHRDLKPANVMVVRDTMGREQPKVLDFGIAKELHSGEPDLTSRGAFVGTPKYMAPEQFRKQPATGRTDLYAAGLLLYTMLTGRPPFMPEDPVPADLRELPEDARMAWLHLHRLPRPIGNVSNELNDLLAGLLAKTPADRVSDARRALAALGATPEMRATHETGSHRTEPELSPVSLDQPPTRISATGGPVAGETTALPFARRLTRAGMLGVALGGLFVVGMQLNGAPFLAEDTVEPVRIRAMPSSRAVCHDPVTSAPGGADVWRGAQWLGQTPFVLSRPCSESWTVVFRHKDHVTLQVAFPRHAAEVESPVRLPELVGAEADDVDAPSNMGPAPSVSPPSAAPNRPARRERARAAPRRPGGGPQEAAALPFTDPEDLAAPGRPGERSAAQGRDEKAVRSAPEARGASPLYF
jgi:hypothetical protein